MNNKPYWWGKRILLDLMGEKNKSIGEKVKIIHNSTT
jgi:hypothetical protein